MLSDTINSTVQKSWNENEKSLDSNQLEIRRIKHVCQLYQLALDKM